MFSVLYEDPRNPSKVTFEYDGSATSGTFFVTLSPYSDSSSSTWQDELEYQDDQPKKVVTFERAYKNRREKVKAIAELAIEISMFFLSEEQANGIALLLTLARIVWMVTRLIALAHSKTQGNFLSFLGHCLLDIAIETIGDSLLGPLFSKVQVS